MGHHANDQRCRLPQTGPRSGHQQILLRDLCVFANFAINLPKHGQRLRIRLIRERMCRIDRTSVSSARLVSTGSVVSPRASSCADRPTGRETVDLRVAVAGLAQHVARMLAECRGETRQPCTVAPDIRNGAFITAETAARRPGPPPPTPRDARAADRRGPRRLPNDYEANWARPRDRTRPGRRRLEDCRTRVPVRRSGPPNSGGGRVIGGKSADRSPIRDARQRARGHGRCAHWRPAGMMKPSAVRTGPNIGRPAGGTGNCAVCAPRRAAESASTPASRRRSTGRGRSAGGAAARSSPRQTHRCRSAHRRRRCRNCPVGRGPVDAPNARCHSPTRQGSRARRRRGRTTGRSGRSRRSRNRPAPDEQASLRAP